MNVMPIHQNTGLVEPINLFGKIPPFRARYKDRVPDPGECIITSLDWETQKLSMSNGACRYFPTFEEVDFTLTH